jgi:hypothetical protein
MDIHFHAIYRAGAIHPDQPLGLPDNTQLNVVAVPIEETTKDAMVEEARRPIAPRFTAAELRKQIGKSAVRVGSLPADFSREDIYSDHD